MSPRYAFLIGWFGGAAVAATMTIATYHLRLNDLRAEAVKRGVAEWVVDPANGDTTFEWKEVTP